jgi:predicted RNA-binding Zn-ribbon protein involved in translation (DUF1610 family)
MKCPYCGNEMTMGYIQCRDGVRWTLNLQPVAALSFLGKESTSLANGASDGSSAVYAYKCAECRKVIIDYSDEQYRFLGKL